MNTAHKLSIDQEAILSPDLRYRYVLSRSWCRDSKRVLFVGLNPSTADATKDDPTIRRCIRFAADWGYGGFDIVNLFAWRSSDPTVLTSCVDPIGPDNDAWIEELSVSASMTIVAWGFRGQLMDRAEAVMNKIRNPYCLGRTKQGHPRHPLYVKACTKPSPW